MSCRWQIAKRSPVAAARHLEVCNEHGSHWNPTAGRENLLERRLCSILFGSVGQQHVRVAASTSNLAIVARLCTRRRKCKIRRIVQLQKYSTFRCPSTRCKWGLCRSQSWCNCKNRRTARCQGRCTFCCPGTGTLHQCLWSDRCSPHSITMMPCIQV